MPGSSWVEEPQKLVWLKKINSLVARAMLVHGDRCCAEFHPMFLFPAQDHIYILVCVRVFFSQFSDSIFNGSQPTLRVAAVFMFSRAIHGTHCTIELVVGLRPFLSGLRILLWTWVPPLSTVRPRPPVTINMYML